MMDGEKPPETLDDTDDFYTPLADVIREHVLIAVRGVPMPRAKARALGLIETDDADRRQLRDPATYDKKPTPDDVIATYYRRHTHNRKISLKQVCEDLHVNYNSIRVAKVAYDKRRKRGRSD
jgi:hypothetical protein